MSAKTLSTSTSIHNRNGNNTITANNQPKPSFGRLLFLKSITLITIITFLWSGLVINLLQVILYSTLRRVNFKLFTKINYYLMYTAYSQVVVLFDLFFGARVTVYHANREQEDEMFSNHSIFLPNHNYNLDWIAAWMVADKYGHLANCKAMLKNNLRYIPIVGWSWSMSDQLFLDREWEKDKHKLDSSIDTLLKYDPMVATFFCEGTRFATSTYQECVKFAAERGIEAPKYHLIPRTKGFVAVMRHLKLRHREDPKLKVNIYNTQVAFNQNHGMTIGDIVAKGAQPRGHLYLEKIPFDEIPDNDEECAKWLHDLFLKKDNLEEHFRKHQAFPGHIDTRFVNYKPRLVGIANWLFWISYTLIPFGYLISNLYARYGAFYVSLAMSVFFMLSYIYLNFIMDQADVSEGKPALPNSSKTKNNKTA